MSLVTLTYAFFFIFFLIFQIIHARTSSSPSNEELSGKHAGHDPLGHGARQAVSMHCIPRIAHPRSLASCCDRIHLVGSSSGAIHPPGKSIHASKHPCTAIQSPKKQQRPLPSVLYIVRRNICKRKHVQALQQRACSIPIPLL